MLKITFAIFILCNIGFALSNTNTNQTIFEIIGWTAFVWATIEFYKKLKTTI